MISSPNGRGVRRLAIGLAVLSLLSLVVTTWIFSTVRREQVIVSQLVKHLPASDLDDIKELSGELNLQRSLLFLLVLNVVASGVALVFVVRAYLSSEQTLADVKVLSSDILASMDAGVITTDQTGVLTSINPSGRVIVDLPADDLSMTDEGFLTELKINQLGREHALLADICDESRRFDCPIRDRDYCVDRDGHTQTLRAGLQHEIKNPLSALALHVQLLCERLAKETDDAEINESLDVLDCEVKRIGTVLDGFRNYASVNDIGRSPVDVSLLIEKLVRLLRPQAENQHVKIKVQSSGELLGLIQADSMRLEQVLLNLALNAIAAMPGGGTLAFAISGESTGIRIDVSDTGHGIPAEIQSQVFDPYFTTRREGTGMGLALCDKIIRQHNGNLDFQTGPSGTTFTLQLPQSADHSE